MVFSLSLVTPHTFAYWRTSLTGDTHSLTGTTTTTGTWTQTFIVYWDANGTYLSGDIVSHNGVDYRAKKDNPTKEPGVDGGWTSQWTAL